MKGGKREGAGRKRSEAKKDSVVIRVDKNLVPIIELIKEAAKNKDDTKLIRTVMMLKEQDPLTQLAMFLKPYR